MKIKSAIILLLLITVSVYSQSTDDYRAVSSGNWTDSSIWEVFDGTGWILASNYPGEIAGTNDVTIGNGVTVTINSLITESINSVTLGDQTGGIDNLLITNDSYIETTSFTIAYDGFLDWGGPSSGNHLIGFPAGTNFIVESPNPDTSLELGIDHGINEDHNSCSSSKAIEIDGTRYSTCSGGGGPGVISFDVLNDGGGNLTASPTATPSPSCANTSIQLSANPGGTETPSSYSWTAIAPTTYSFSSTLENPTDTPTVAGTYIYEVTIDNGDSPPIETTATITVEVETCAPKRIITNRRITYRVKK